MQHKIFPKELMIKTMFYHYSQINLIITLSHCLACKPFDINFIVFQSECNHTPMCFGYGCVALSVQDVLELVPDFYFSMPVPEEAAVLMVLLTGLDLWDWVFSCHACSVRGLAENAPKYCWLHGQLNAAPSVKDKQVCFKHLNENKC